MKRAVSRLALLMVGWYLLMPPQRFQLDVKDMERCSQQLEPGPDCTDLTAPLGDWWQSRSYDTAAQCTDDLIDKGSIKMTQAGHTEEWLTYSMPKGLCVASDDPRLKEHRRISWLCLPLDIGYFCPP